MTYSNNISIGIYGTSIDILYIDMLYGDGDRHTVSRSAVVPNL